MARAILITLALWFAVSPLACSREAKDGIRAIGLRVVADAPLGSGATRWDYQSINYQNQRLYISHLGSNAVTVFDLKSQKMIAEIPDVKQPFGILVVPELNTVYVSSSGNRVAVIDEDSLKVKRYIQAGQTPDGIAYDPRNKRIFVSNKNGGTITVINAITNEFIENIPFAKGVGNTQYDPLSGLIYSVSGSENKLAEIDPATNKIVNTYSLPSGSYPHGLYIDEYTHFAFIACQGTDQLITFDLEQKTIISTETTGHSPDVLAFDPILLRLYVASEVGEMAVFQVSKDKIIKLGQAFIADRAHTVSVDRDTHRVYMPLEDVNGKPVMRMFEPVR